MIAVMKSIDSLYVRVRVFVFVCGWVIVCVWVIVFVWCLYAVFLWARLEVNLRVVLRWVIACVVLFISCIMPVFVVCMCFMCFVVLACIYVFFMSVKTTTPGS
jgi:hypothetical protein